MVTIDYRGQKDRNSVLRENRILHELQQGHKRKRQFADSKSLFLPGPHVKQQEEEVWRSGQGLISNRST